MIAEDEHAALDLGNAGIGFLLVILAGSSTAVGAAAVFERRIVRLASKPVLASGVAFSGGVMLHVSSFDIFFKAEEAFAAHTDSHSEAHLYATLCFFAGMMLLRMIHFAIDRLDKSNQQAGFESDIIGETLDVSTLASQAPPTAPGDADASGSQKGVPSASGVTSTNDEESPSPQAEEVDADVSDVKVEVDEDTGSSAALVARSQLQKMGLHSAVAIGVHNFPEGFATFIATLANPRVGATLAFAIAVHNVPEGLCVALPIYYATGSRLKGFLWAVLSGVSEPIGAVVAWLVVKGTGADMSQVFYGTVFGLVAGVMTMIVVSELFPTAYKYDPKDKYTTYSIAAGMAVMAASLCLFRA